VSTRISNRNYYKILQIDPTAEQEVVQAAYRRLVQKYHPDVNGTTDATARMQEINEAYEVLGDPDRRADYDRFLARPTQQADTKNRDQDQSKRQKWTTQTARGDNPASRRKSQLEGEIARLNREIQDLKRQILTLRRLPITAVIVNGLGILCLVCSVIVLFIDTTFVGLFLLLGAFAFLLKSVYTDEPVRKRKDLRTTCILEKGSLEQKLLSAENELKRLLDAVQ
jgi:hypothetical protein